MLPAYTAIAEQSRISNHKFDGICTSGASSSSATASINASRAFSSHVPSPSSAMSTKSSTATTSIQRASSFVPSKSYYFAITSIQQSPIASSTSQSTYSDAKFSNLSIVLSLNQRSVIISFGAALNQLRPS